MVITMREVLIQLIGVIAWILLITSYRTKTTKTIILVQISSSLLYVVHYYFLNAYSGLFICALTLFTGVLYYFVNNKRIAFLFIIPIALASAYFFYTGILSLMPVIALLIDEYSFTKYKNTVIKYSIISHILWVLYDVSVLSYSCIVTDSLVAISNLIMIISHNKTNLLKVEETRPLIVRKELFK